MSQLIAATHARMQCHHCSAPPCCKFLSCRSCCAASTSSNWYSHSPHLNTSPLHRFTLDVVFGTVQQLLLTNLTFTTSVVSQYSIRRITASFTTHSRLETSHRRVTVSVATQRRLAYILLTFIRRLNYCFTNHRCIVLLRRFGLRFTHHPHVYVSPQLARFFTGCELGMTSSGRVASHKFGCLL